MITKYKQLRVETPIKYYPWDSSEVRVFRLTAADWQLLQEGKTLWTGSEWLTLEEVAEVMRGDK